MQKKFKVVYETLYSSADTQAEMAELLTKVEALITQNFAQEVLKVTGSKVKEAACQMKPRKGDVSSGFTSDALLNAPDIINLQECSAVS